MGVFEDFGLRHGLARLVREFAVGPLLQPLGAAARLLVQQRFQIHGGGGAVLLAGLDGDGAAARLFEAEAHHGLVDGTDVLHVQGAVGDALAAEHDELFQHAVDGAVAHPRRLDAFAHPPGAANDVAAAFEEAVALRVEQGAVAGGSFMAPEWAPSWTMRNRASSWA